MIMIAFTLLACGGAEEKGSTSIPDVADQFGQDFSPVIARIGDVDITQAYFDFRYANISATDKERYSGDNWKNRFLDYLVDETLLYQQAEAEKFDLWPEVERRLDVARRSILVKAYHDKKFRDDVKASDEAVAEHYESNKEQYRTLGRALGYHIMNENEDRIREAYEKLQAGDLRFGQAAAQYSQDENTRTNEGLVGWFNPDGYVMGLGFVQDFTNAAFATPENGYTEPIRIGDNWHIIKVGAKVAAEQLSLEDASDRISTELRPVIARELYEAHMKELKATLGVERYGEYQQDDSRTAEQLFRLGAETRNNHAKLYYYQTLVDQYPDDERAHQAQFMVGFIQSEEFGSTGEAAVSFRKLIRNYPDSEYAESAQYMLKNLGRSQPTLREGSPQAPSDVHGKIQELQGQ